MEKEKRKYTHKMSPEERSAIARENASHRTRIGRPKGSKNKVQKPRMIKGEHYTSLNCKVEDYLVFRKFSLESGLSLMQFMHTIAQSLIAKNRGVVECEKQELDLKNDCSKENENANEIRSESSTAADNE